MVADELARRHGAQLPLEVLGPRRRHPDRRRAGRAARAADVHERVRALGRCGGTLLQGAARRRCSSCTTRSISRSDASRCGSEAAWPATTASARSPRTWGRRDFLRLRIGVGRPERGDPRPVADFVLSPFDRRGRCGRRSSLERPMLSRRWRRAASRRLSSASTSASGSGLAEPLDARAAAASPEARETLTRAWRTQARALAIARARNGGGPVSREPRSEPLGWPRGTRRPVDDRTRCLEALALELADSERLRAFRARSGATAARVSEPLLPLFLAALLALRREAGASGLVCLLPEDADARDAADAAGWFLGAERVGLLASRGVSFESGLAPPPHLVGERAGRSRCFAARRSRLRVGARASRRACRRRRLVPRRIRSPSGDEPGVEGLAEQLALAGYERVDRVERARPVRRPRRHRRRLPVDRTRAGPRGVLRRTRSSSIRAFSPFTQRTLHPLEDAVVYPAAERRLTRLGPTELGRRATCREVAGGPRRRRIGRCDFVWEPDARARGLARRSWATRLGSSRASSITASRPGSSSRSRRSGRPSRRGAWRRPRTTSRASSAPGNRVVVAFAHRGEAMRTKAHATQGRRRAARAGRGPARASRELLFAVAPVRRGFVSRELGIVLLPDTQVFRKRAAARRRAARPGAPELRRPAARRLRRPRGPRRRHGCSASRRRPSPASRATTSSSRSAGEDRLYVPHEQIGKVSRYVGARGCVACALEARRQGVAEPEGTRARRRPRARRRAARALRAAPAGRRDRAATSTAISSSSSRRASRTRRHPTSSARSRPSRRISRLRAPWTGSSAATWASGRPRSPSGRRSLAVANGKQALVLAPTTVLAQQHWNTFRERYGDLPVGVEMVSRFRRPGGGEERSRRVPRRARSTC